MKQEGITYYYKDIKIKVVEMIEFLSEYKRKRSMKLETLLLRDFFHKNLKHPLQVGQKLKVLLSHKNKGKKED